MKFSTHFLWFGVPADTTGDSEFQVTFQPWFYYRIHFCKLQEEFYVSERFLQNPYWNCFYSTTEHRSTIFTTYSEILVPNTPVLKIIMSILLSIFGSTGFWVWDFEMVVPREWISSGGFYVYSSQLGHSDQVHDHDKNNMLSTSWPHLDHLG